MVHGCEEQCEDDTMPRLGAGPPITWQDGLRSTVSTPCKRGVPSRLGPATRSPAAP